MRCGSSRAADLHASPAWRQRAAHLWAAFFMLGFRVPLLPCCIPRADETPADDPHRPRPDRRRCAGALHHLLRAHARSGRVVDRRNHGPGRPDRNPEHSARDVEPVQPGTHEERRGDRLHGRAAPRLRYRRHPGDRDEPARRTGHRPARRRTRPHGLPVGLPPQRSDHGRRHRALRLPLEALARAARGAGLAGALPRRPDRPRAVPRPLRAAILRAAHPRSQPPRRAHRKGPRARDHPARYAPPAVYGRPRHHPGRLQPGRGR